jgi:hypothetical protein
VKQHREDTAIIALQMADALLVEEAREQAQLLGKTATRVILSVLCQEYPGLVPKSPLND